MYSFPYIEAGKVKLQHFPSCTLFGTKQVLTGKQGAVFLTSGKEKLSYSIFSLVLYSAHSRLVVNSVHFSPYIVAGKVNLQHFTSRCSIPQVVEILPYIYLV